MLWGSFCGICNSVGMMNDDDFFALFSDNARAKDLHSDQPRSPFENKPNVIKPASACLNLAHLSMNFASSLSTKTKSVVAFSALRSFVFTSFSKWKNLFCNECIFIHVNKEIHSKSWFENVFYLFVAVCCFRFEVENRRNELQLLDILVIWRW